MKIIGGISDFIYKVEKVLIIILIPLVLFSMVLDIFLRYFFGLPTQWGQELSLYTFVWSTFIGASMSIKTKQAVSMSLVVDKVGDLWRSLLIIAGLIISLIFIVFMLYLSIEWITSSGIMSQFTPTSRIPMIYLYTCIPISLAFMVIHLVNWVFEAILAHRNGEMIE